MLNLANPSKAASASIAAMILIAVLGLTLASDQSSSALASHLAVMI